jgi:hypothetical protein
MLEPSSEACMSVFDNTWLPRYPHPQYIGYDNGNEYKNVFKELEPSSEACMSVFDNTWLPRYPHPQYIGYDNGNEYKNVFKEMCLNYGIKGKKSTTYNPQSNGIIEHVHQVLGNSLHTFELKNRS